MAIPLIYWAAAALAGAAALSNSSDERVITPATIGPLKAIAKMGIIGATTAGPKLSGPLPQAALEAWNAPKSGRGRRRSAYGPKNDIHKRASWLRYATYSKRFHYKLDVNRIYSDPPGALRLISKDNARNLAWMMRCRSDWYPGYGKAQPRNIRLDAVKQYLSPKADWDTFKGLFKDTIDSLPAVIEGAGVITAGVTSGGASLQKNPKEQADAVFDSIKSALAPIGNVGESISKRLEAAEIIYLAFADAYIGQVMAANPHAVRNGRLDIGKHYHDEPRTYEELGQEGGSRPLLWNP